MSDHPLSVYRLLDFIKTWDYKRRPRHICCPTTTDLSVDLRENPLLIATGEGLVQAFGGAGADGGEACFVLLTPKGRIALAKHHENAQPLDGNVESAGDGRKKKKKPGPKKTRYDVAEDKKIFEQWKYGLD